MSVDSGYPKTEIFIGPADSGKTRRAKELAEGKNAKFFEGRRIGYKRIMDNPFYFSDLDGTEELIVVDDVPLKFLNDFLYWLFNPDMIVDRQGQRPITFRRPPMIITVECDDYELIGASMQRRFSIVKFPEAAYTNWFNRFFSVDSGRLDQYVSKPEAQQDFCIDFKVASKEYMLLLAKWCQDQGYELNPKEKRNANGYIVRNIDGVAWQCIYIDTNPEKKGGEPQ